MIKQKIKVDKNYNNFDFSAIRGIQAGREYYVVMCPMDIIPRLFLFNEVEIPPKLRAQRKLNKSRIPEMASYLTKNEKTYVFSSITASIDGYVKFIPADKKGRLSKVGRLIVPINTKFLINDGQHRRAAIEHALKERPELKNETISVVFYIDRGLKMSQQMFSDLNKHAVRPTTSLNILYDHRDPFGQALQSTFEKIPIFNEDLIECEKTSISNRSGKVFTLNSIYKASKELLGKNSTKPTISDDEKKLLVEYWNAVYDNIFEWKDAVNGKTAPYILRENYVHVHGILLHALGVMGKELVNRYPKNWKSKLKKLRTVDWERSNQVWDGKALVNGRLSKQRENIVQTSNYLKEIVGLHNGGE